MNVCCLWIVSGRKIALKRNQLVRKTSFDVLLPGQPVIHCKLLYISPEDLFVYKGMCVSGVWGGDNTFSVMKLHV